MALVSNPYYPHLQKCFERISEVDFYFSAISYDLRRFQENLLQQIEKHGDDHPVRFTGRNFTIFDLTEPGTGSATPYPVSGRHSSGRHYHNLIQRVRWLLAGDTVADSYEIFESFLKDIVAEYLMRHSADEPQTKVTKFDSSGAANNLTKGSFEYWRAYFPFTYNRGNEHVLKFLRAKCVEIAQFETNNVRGRDLNQWFIAITEVRHGVTHSGHRISESRIRNWQRSDVQVLNRLFRNVKASEHDSEFQLQIDEGQATGACQSLAEYAYLIFRCISKAETLEYHLPCMKPTPPQDSTPPKPS